MKVQSTRAALAALLFAGVVLTGCDRTTEVDPSNADADANAAVAPVGSRFGDPYEIVTGWTAADPDILPTIEADTLVVLVGYPGGCEDHAFRLDTETARDTVRLWLRHDADGDDCEAYLRDEVRLPVPGGARRAATIALLNPQGGPPFIVDRVEAP